MAKNLRQMPPRELLDEYPHRLGLRVSMVQTAVYADLVPRYAPLGLTSPSRGTALNHIVVNPGCNQMELGTFTGVSRASTMTMVNQLEAAGLVERRSEQGDARTNKLFVTERGNKAIFEAHKANAVNEELIFGCLSEPEKAQLGQLLEKIITYVDNQKGRMS